MIEPGAGWRFREGIGDRGTFEDQVLEHLVTGQVAVRRVFNAGFSRDEVAASQVCAQTELVGRAQDNGAPRPLRIETVEDCLCIWMEMVEGVPLTKATKEQVFFDPQDWAEGALAVVRLLRGLDAKGGRLDRISLADIVETQGRLKVKDLWLGGAPSSGDVEKSQNLQRLMRIAGGGAYYAEGPAPTAENLERTRELLFQMATGQWERGMEASLALARPDKIEADILEVLQRIGAGNRADGINDFAQLEAAVEAMLPDKPVFLREAHTVAEDEAERLLQEAMSHRGPHAQTGHAAPVIPSHLMTSASQSGDAGEQEDAGEEQKEKPKAAATRRRRKKETGSPLVVFAIIAGIVVIAFAGFAISRMLAPEKPNEKPVAVIAPFPETITTFQQYAIDGSQSSDKEGSKLSFDWDMQGRTESGGVLRREDVRLLGPTHGTGVEKVPIEVFVPGRFTVRLRVFDGQLYSEIVSQELVVVEKPGADR